VLILFQCAGRASHGGELPRYRPNGVILADTEGLVRYSPFEGVATA
jgi:hypothetical protein